MMFDGKVKVLGRYFEDGKALWLSTSGAFVEFQVEGATYVALNLTGDRAAVEEDHAHLRARYRLEVDGEGRGEFLLDERKRAHRLALADGGRHVARIVKLSEAAHSSLGVETIKTDGEISPTAKKARRIEFIGDSITCGYGVEGTLDMPFTTATENALMAYAARTAQALDADFVLTAFSGFGIVSGYTGDGAINSRCLVPKYYESVSMCDEPLPDGRFLMDIPWDFSVFVPDTIVINLGTNDMSYCRDDAQKRRAYRDLYVEFLKTVRRRNPDARILCVLGVMGETLNGEMDQAVRLFAAETGDGNVRALCVTEQDPALGYGSDYHPSPATQARLAREVTRTIEAWDAEK